MSPYDTPIECVTMVHDSIFKESAASMTNWALEDTLNSSFSEEVIPKPGNAKMTSLYSPVTQPTIGVSGLPG